MSTGGVFQLISNTGFQDEILMAHSLLTERIKCIRKQRMEELRMKHKGVPDSELEKMPSAWSTALASIDKTHIFYVNSTFKPFVSMAHEYSRTPSRGGQPTLGNTCSFELPLVGQFVNDPVLYVKLNNFSAVNSLDKVRYAAYLGHRLMKNVKFKVQNFLFDEYGTDEQMAYFDNKVPVHKENAYLRSIGQEVPKLGYLTADPAVDEVREYRWFGNGPQTFKQAQPTLELWIPILFWFKDINCSLPNFLLPRNQVEIEVTFEQESNLVSYGNYGGGGSYRAPKIAECYMYVNHIFVMPEIEQLFRNSFGSQLIRVHRSHRELLTESSKSVKLHQIKYPVEALYVGFRPTANLTNSQRWYKNTFITARTSKQAVVTGVSTVQVNDASYLDEAHCVEKLGLKAHDVTIFPDLPPEFYNNYIPFRYGKYIKSSHQLGWYLMNFNFEPGNYQPSGYINVTKTRELYLNYQSAIDSATGQYIIRTANPVELIVLADALNFVYVDARANNMTLRFAT
jgi:hypothetical protein